MKYSESLKKNRDFQQVYKRGTSKANRYLVMYVLPNQHMKNRLGISVSKKVGNSVVRHRITRLVRESYRLNESLFKKNLDIVVIARNSANGTNYHEIEKAFMDLARKHGIAGDKVNEETYITDEENKVSLYSHLFSIWFGSNRKIWCIKGRITGSLANFKM